jgi:ribosomal protein S18 acetylase RimI-like enzyme
LNVRPATLDDTPSLNFLRQERVVLLQQSDSRLTAPTLNFASALHDSHCAVLVGEQEGRIAGYTVGYVEMCPMGALPPGVGYIAELTLDAHRYYGGLGRMLYRALRDWFSQRGVTRVIVHVPRYHAVEQAFWRSLGAVEDSLPVFEHVPALVWMIFS